MKVVLFTKKDHEYENRYHLFNSVFQKKYIEYLIVTPENHPNPKTEEFKKLRSKIEDFKPDLIVSFFYSKRIQNVLISSARLGGVNFHPSILPSYPGAHALNWQLVNGERISGVTLHELTSKIDKGKIIDREIFQVSEYEDINDIHKKAIEASVKILSRLDRTIENNSKLIEKIDAKYKLTYPDFECRVRTENDSLIPTEADYFLFKNKVRALQKPWSGAFYYNNLGKKVVLDDLKDEADYKLAFDIFKKDTTNTR